jgi:hypothetical protein
MLNWKLQTTSWATKSGNFGGDKEPLHYDLGRKLYIYSSFQNFANILLYDPANKQAYS